MRSRVDAHAHGEAYLSEPYRPWGVSNIKAIYPLIPGARRPLLRRSLLRRRIIPGYLRTPSPLAGGRSLRGLSFPRVSGNSPVSGPLAFCDLVSLHSLSYLWVSGRRRLLGLASTPSISSPSTVFPTCGYRGGDFADIWIGDARYVSCWRHTLRLSWRRIGC